MKRISIVRLLAFFALFILFASPNHGQAQYPAFQCPGGSRQVQVGGAIMCQCPDGSYASINGCRSQPAQPQYRQPQQGQVPQYRGTPQQRTLNVRREFNNRARAQAFNPSTQRWEQRVGQNRTVDGRRMWFSNVYKGPGYVQLPEGHFVEIPEDQYEEIYGDLTSDDESRIETAIIAIVQIAIAVGVIDAESRE